MDAEVDGHYKADNWFPHITLCDGRVDVSQVSGAMRRLVEGPAVAWTLRMSRLIELMHTGPVTTAAFRGSSGGHQARAGHHDEPLQSEGSDRPASLL